MSFQSCHPARSRGSKSNVNVSDDEFGNDIFEWQGKLDHLRGEGELIVDN